jgi:hypothetical protein
MDFDPEKLAEGFCSFDPIGHDDNCSRGTVR